MLSKSVDWVLYEAPLKYFSIDRNFTIMNLMPVASLILQHQVLAYHTTWLNVFSLKEVTTIKVTTGVTGINYNCKMFLLFLINRNNTINTSL